MKLLTKEILAQFAKLGSQDGKGGDAIVVAKYFHPIGRYTFFATEYDPETKHFFGWGINFEAEWGYASLDEWVACVVRGCGIERDLSFHPGKLRDVLIQEHKEAYPL